MLSATDQKRVHVCPKCGKLETLTLSTKHDLKSDKYIGSIYCTECDLNITAEGDKRDASRFAVIKKWNSLKKEDFIKKETPKQRKILHLNQHAVLTQFLDKKAKEQQTKNNPSPVTPVENRYKVLNDYEEIIWALNAGLVVEQIINGQKSVLVGRRNSFPHTSEMINFLIALGFLGGEAKTSEEFHMFMGI